MNAPEFDPVDRALGALAGDDALELPDPRLNERLLRTARGRGDARTTGWGGLWTRAAVILLLVGGSGAALGATVGFDWIRAWWYSIVIDGEEVRGEVEGEGQRRVDFVTPDGCRVSVRVGRRPAPGNGVQTNIDVSEVDDDRVEHNFEEIVTPGSGDDLPSLDQLPREALNGAELLHTWTDPSGLRRSIWLGADPEGPGARLMVEDVGSTEAWPVRLALRTARPIAAGGRVSIDELPGGTLDISLSNGQGWEIAVLIAPSEGASGSPPEEYVSPSGRVRVRVGD